MSAIRPILRRSPLRIYVAGGRRSPGNFLRLLQHEPTSKPFSTSTSSSDSGAAVSFFETSCGLSPSAAVAAAAQTKIKTTANAESVFCLLQSYGFTKSNIALIAAKAPCLFSFHPEKCIKPKLDLFVAEGFTENLMVKIFSKDPNLLTRSLERKLSPNLHLLMTVFGGDRKAVAASISRNAWILSFDLKKNMLPNMETLRKHGAGANIIGLVRWWPRAITQEPGRFSKTVVLLRDMGFDSSNTLFIHGIQAMTGLSPLAWERKLQLFRSLGWSHEETISAFKKNPNCMHASEEKIRKVMAFFIKNLKWEPSHVALLPSTLNYSFEKRIVPRYAVFNILSTSGLLDMKFSTFLIMGEGKFLKKYLCKYSDTVPELLEAYKAKLDMAATAPFNFVL